MNFAIKATNVAFNFVRHANETDRDSAHSRPKLARIPAGYSRKSTGSNERSPDFLHFQIIQHPIAKQLLARPSLLTLRAAAEWPRSEGRNGTRELLQAMLQWGRG